DSLRGAPVPYFGAPGPSGRREAREASASRELARGPRGTPAPRLGGNSGLRKSRPPARGPAFGPNLPGRSPGPSERRGPAEPVEPFEPEGRPSEGLPDEA